MESQGKRKKKEGVDVKTRPSVGAIKKGKMKAEKDGGRGESGAPQERKCYVLKRGKTRWSARGGGYVGPSWKLGDYTQKWKVEGERHVKTPDVKAEAKEGLGKKKGKGN